MLSLLIGFLAPTVGEKWAKPAAWGIVAAVVLVLLGVGKCTYDHSVIAKHEQKAEIRQVQRERKADTNLNQQVGRDDTAAQQRKQEIDNATRNIPDQAPSARQRSIACVELRREAKQRRKPEPAC
jgi:uncharacterized protein HemX